MLVESVFGIVIAFVTIVAGSYVGSKMALNAFFGREFDPSEVCRAEQEGSESDNLDR